MSVESQSVSNVEQEPRVIGKITVFRHGQTLYTEEYPDLTPVGVETIEQTGEALKDLIGATDEVLLLSSPSPRARGSADVAAGRLDNDHSARIFRPIRSAEQRDPERAMEVYMDIMGGERKPKLVDIAYPNDPRFEDNPEIFEPRSNVEARFYRALEYAIRGFQNREGEKTPHIVAASHFELLNHFVRDLFELPTDEENVLRHGEPIHIEVIAPDPDSSMVELEVSFRGETRRCSFDRESRSIVT